MNEDEERCPTCQGFRTGGFTTALHRDCPDPFHPVNADDERRERAVELMKKHARCVRPDTDYTADIEYLEDAVLAFADEWSRLPRVS